MCCLCPLRVTNSRLSFTLRLGHPLPRYIYCSTTSLREDNLLAAVSFVLGFMVGHSGIMGIWWINS